MAHLYENELSPGVMVGEYRIERIVATGGMGTVYAATHPVIGKKVAVKLLRRQFCTNPTVVQRFVDEARAVNQIGHQNIVDVFAFGALPDGRSYLVMEWLEGETLADRLDRDVLTPLESLTVLEQLCGALEVVHAQGIVHRDLKPANLFLVPQRQGGFGLKLVDFGIAKLGAADERSSQPRDKTVKKPLTLPAMFLGTLGYVSPEQARGRVIDRKADVYSVGVIAYELFTGRLPFRSENPVELIAELLESEADRPSKIWPPMPPALEAIILQMLDKDPARRPELSGIRALFQDLRTAALLLSARHSSQSTNPRALLPRRRPILVRSFPDVASLIPPVLHDLADGIAWIAARGVPPEAGSPITVRYSVDHLALHLDFGAVTESQFGAEGKKILVRFDRVAKARLEAIFGVASEVTLRPAPSDQAPVRAEWTMPPEEARPHPSIWARDRALWPSSTAEATRITLVDAGPSAVALEEAPPEQAVALSRRTSIAAGVGRVPKERRASFGLAAKFLAISVCLTAGSVLVVTGLALERVKADRSFYLRDLDLRTSRLLARAVGAQLDGWRDELLRVAIDPDAGTASSFAGVARCRGRHCEALSGAMLDRGLLETMLPEVRPGALSLLSYGDMVLAATSTRGVAAVATLPAEAVLAGAEVAPELTFAVVDRNLHVLAARGRLAETGQAGSSERDERNERDDQGGRVAGLAEHIGALESQIHGEGGAGSGAREYVSPDGAPMLAAFARTHGLVLLAIVPLEVAAETGRVLKRQIALVALAVICVAAIVAVAFSSGLSRRLRHLARLVNCISEGDFSVKVGLSGKDEVAQLARTFDAMARALEQREQDVLRIQQEMREDETRTAHKQLSAWLESDLASKLSAMDALLQHPLSRQDPLQDLIDQRAALRELSRQASTSLEQALSFAAIASKRIDFGGVVSEAVGLSRRALEGDGLTVEVEAPNALMFPRIEARESDVREIVQLLVEGVGRLADRGSRIVVQLHREEERLLLLVRFRARQLPERAEVLLDAVRDLLVGSVEPAFTRAGHWTVISLGFPIRAGVEI